MQAGKMDKYMKLLYPKKKLSKQQLGEYRQNFVAVESFDAKHPWVTSSPTTEHVRLMLKAEPQIGKTGENDGGPQVFDLHCRALLQPCLAGALGTLFAHSVDCSKAANIINKHCKAFASALLSFPRKLSAP